MNLLTLSVLPFSAAGDWSTLARRRPALSRVFAFLILPLALARRKQECAEASETLAFDAQDKWLRLFSSDLETEFQIDGFTRVVAALCIHP